MAKTPNKLSDTARAMLTLAATREDRLVRPPHLPTAAARQVVRSLLNNGFVEEVPASIEDAAYTWRTTDDSSTLMLRATDAGLAAIGATAPTKPQTIDAFTRQVLGFLAEEGCNATILEEAEVQTMLEDGFSNGRPAGRVAGDILTWLAEEEERAEEAAEAANPGDTDADTATDDAVAREAAAVADALDAASKAPTRANLRVAAQAVLDAWTDAANRETDIIAALEAPMAALRTALGARIARPVKTSPRAPRTGTKQEAILALLRRPEGATIAQITAATNWQSHTARGFLAGLKKKGIQVDVLDRVRQVGPNKDGAKGSFSIYKVAG